MIMEHEESKRLLIADLEGMSDTKKIQIFWGDKSFTPLGLAKEIRDETEIGKKHIEMHSRYMERKNDTLISTPKYWWQFWK